MMRKFLLVAAVVGIAGCVAPPPRPVSPPEVVNTTAPVCGDKRQCEAMWLEAQSAIEVVTRMRIRLATDSRIETFAPTRYGSMGGVVTKYPVDDDKYELRLRLECFRNSECNDMRAAGTNLFNLLVTGPKSK